MTVSAKKNKEEMEAKVFLLKIRSKRWQCNQRRRWPKIKKSNK